MICRLLTIIRDAIRVPASAAVLRAAICGADVACAGALRFVRGTEDALSAIERGLKKSKNIPSLQGHRTRIGGGR